MKLYALTNPLSHGEDLKPLQKALKAAKLYNGPIDGIFGRGTGQSCKTAKYRLGYPKDRVTQTGGQTLLDYLTGKMELPVAFKARRKLRGYATNKTQEIRDAIVSHSLWGVSNKGSIDYAQVRPMDHLNQVRRLPWVTDCSEFVTTIYKWAGAPDPNGFKFNGLGYTGTMLDNGITIPYWEAEPGDVLIWGWNPGHHTAIYIGDKDCVSMGSSRGPLRITVELETYYQKNRHMTTKRYI
jgi:hypothetical protein